MAEIDDRCTRASTRMIHRKTSATGIVDTTDYIGGNIETVGCEVGIDLDGWSRSEGQNPFLFTSETTPEIQEQWKSLPNSVEVTTGARASKEHAATGGDYWTWFSPLN